MLTEWLLANHQDLITKASGAVVMSKRDTPYTSNTNRLADVIAAIQVMGTYKFYKLDFSDWASRIEGDYEKTAHWQNVFKQHPEFFRLDRNRQHASLVWRRTYQKLYDVDNNELISRLRFNELSDEEKNRISRSPLSNSDISTLVNTAINLHSSEISHKQDSRWWLGAALALLGVVIGLLADS